MSFRVLNLTLKLGLSGLSGLDLGRDLGDWVTISPGTISFVSDSGARAKLFWGLSPSPICCPFPALAFCANSLALTRGRDPNLFLSVGSLGWPGLGLSEGGGGRLAGSRGWGGGPRSGNPETGRGRGRF